MKGSPALLSLLNVLAISKLSYVEGKLLQQTQLSIACCPLSVDFRTFVPFKKRVCRAYGSKLTFNDFLAI